MAIVTKSLDEIEAMRKAGRVVARTLQHIAEMVKPGVKTVTLDRAAEKIIRQSGALPTFKGYHGFPASICVSINEEVVHGIPSARRLKDGDIVSIDCGATLNGYIGDAAITVCVGDCLPEVRSLVDTTRESLMQAISMCLAGNHLGDVSHCVQLCAREKGYGVVKEYCGHGVGRDLHEDPQVPNYGDPRTGPLLSQGLTIAIEPMLNLGTFNVKVKPDGWTVVTADGLPSAHWEHTVAVLDTGPVVLTLP